MALRINPKKHTREETVNYAYQRWYRAQGTKHEVFWLNIHYLLLLTDKEQYG